MTRIKFYNLSNLFLIVAFTLIASISFAEVVVVKYKGATNLEKFTCEQTHSSFVNRICYFKEKNYLVVLLGDTYYHYCGISESVHLAWLSASSKGKFYNSNVKGNYDCRISGVPEGL